MNPKYAIGERVIVLPKAEEYKGKYVDEHGEVIKIYHKLQSSYNSDPYLYGVKLDNHENPRSESNVYWFGAKSIKLENEREEIPMFKNFTVAEVEFIDNPKTGRYAYALYDEEVIIEDVVVVSTGHHGFALAKVVNISCDEESKKEVKHNREVVCRVDFSQFEARKEAVKRAVELKRDMEKHIREAQELALYEALAEKDPTLKGMLDEYRALLESCK